MLVLLTLMLPMASAGCPATRADLRASLDAGVDAYGTWAWDRFGLARADVSSSLGCLTEPLTPEDARRLHLFTALQAGVDKDEARATGAFRALLALDPEFALSEELAAPGSLLRRAFEAAHAETTLSTRKLPKGPWLVDGEAGVRALPLSRPAVVQRQAPEALQTWLVNGEPLPDTLSEALTKPAPKAAKAEAAQAGAAPDRSRRPLALGVASGGALALSAISFGLSWQASRAYPDELDSATAEQLFRANHVYYVSGATLGAVGLGLGLSASWDGLRR